MNHSDDNDEQYVSDTISVKALQQMCLLRTATRTLFAPMDRIKYLLQSQAELHRANRLDYRFSRGSECFRHMITLEGWRSLYRGNMIQVLGLLPSSLAQAFLGVPTTKFVFDLLPHNSPGSFAFASFSSGIAGAFASSLVSYPFDMLRFRLAMDVKPFLGASYEYRNSLEFLSHPHIMDQPHRAYRGLGLYLAGSVLYRGLYLSSWQLVQPILPVVNDDDDDRLVQNGRTSWVTSSRARAIVGQATAGYMTIMLITLWLYPLDTLRRRYMMTVNNPDLEYESVLHCARYIMKTEGPQGFFRGVGFTMLRGLATSMMAMLVGVNI